MFGRTVRNETRGAGEKTVVGKERNKRDKKDILSSTLTLLSYSISF